MKKALTAASLVLIAGALVGCGGDDGGSAPKAASEDDFCAAFEQVTKDMSEVDAEDTKAQIAAAKEAYKKLADVGTPKGIPDDARAGYELLIDTIKEIDDDASQEDLDSIDKDFSDSEDKEIEAFSTYVTETCPDLGAP